MKKPKQVNEAAGEMLCPYRGCELRVPIFRYAQRSSHPLRRRFAGGFYCRCPVHGQFKCTDYILDQEGITWVNQNERSKDRPSESDAAPETPEKPVSAPVPDQSAPMTKQASKAVPFHQRFPTLLHQVNK